MTEKRVYWQKLAATGGRRPLSVALCPNDGLMRHRFDCRMNLLDQVRVVRLPDAIGPHLNIKVTCVPSRLKGLNDFFDGNLAFSGQVAISI